jgi:hypothetical protein
MKPGSMVVLKGHHLFPMVFVRMVEMVTIESPYYPLPAFLGVPAIEPIPRPPIPVDDRKFAEVAWLDSRGVPHDKVYPLELLEEVDG